MDHAAKRVGEPRRMEQNRGTVMADDRFDLRNLEPREFLPWVHLFRGFRIAADLKKILLGAAGVLLTSLGWWIIAYTLAGGLPEIRPEPAPLADSASAEERAAWTEEQRAHETDLMLKHRYEMLERARKFPWQRDGVTNPNVFRNPLDKAPGDGGWVPSAAFLVIEPLERLTFPVRLMLANSHATWVGLLMAVWTLVVWAWIGGAITRIAAVQVARESQVGLREALGFVRDRYMNYLLAPILPMVGVVITILLCAIGGLIAGIPGLNVLMGLVWFLALVAALSVTLVLICLAVGWPLMYAAIGATAAESLDALSQAFSYVLSRPWHYLFYVVIAIIYGGILTTFMVGMGSATVYLSQYAVGWGDWNIFGGGSVQSWYAYVPEAGDWRSSLQDMPNASESAQLSGTVYITALFVGFWTHLVFLVVLGFAYSYFWSSSTIIYFLLRRDVGETEIEEVYLQEEEEEPFPTAVAPPGVGLATGDAGLPIIEPPPAAPPAQFVASPLVAAPVVPPPLVSPPADSSPPAKPAPPPPPPPPVQSAPVAELPALPTATDGPVEPEVPTPDLPSIDLPAFDSPDAKPGNTADEADKPTGT